LNKLQALGALTLFLTAPLGAMAAGPIPPCAGPPLPAYAAIGEPPAVVVYRRADLAEWHPETCAPLRAPRPAVLVALAGRIGGPAERDALLARFGAISAQRGIRYWSVTDRGWRSLIAGAEALSGPTLASPRSDFTADELAAGQDLYFAQQDNRSSAPVIYRLRVRDLAPDRFVIETDNVSPVRYLVMQVYRPGDLHTLFFVARDADGIWNYYSLNEIEGESRFFAVTDQSYVNRAVSFFRLFAGIPTDRDPPAAR
jgi:hypothetical protein